MDTNFIINFSMLFIEIRVLFKTKLSIRWKQKHIHQSRWSLDSYQKKKWSLDNVQNFSLTLFWKNSFNPLRNTNFSFLFFNYYILVKVNNLVWLFNFYGHNGVRHWQDWHHFPPPPQVKVKFSLIKLEFGVTNTKPFF